MDKDLLNDQKKQTFNVYNHWAYLGLKERCLIELDSNVQTSICWKNDQHIQLADKRIVLVNESFKLKQIDKPIGVDYCLISTYVPIRKLLVPYAPELFILDGGLSYYARQLLEKELVSEGLQYYDLKQDGALIVGLAN